MHGNITSGPDAGWDFWRDGLDRSFFQKMYLRSAMVGFAFSLLSLGFDQRPLALGILCGLALGLFSTWTVEVMVRLLFRGGRHSGVKLAFGAGMKLPFLISALLGIAWAGDRHILSVFGVIGGVLTIHGTMFLMIILTALAAQDSNRERYR